MVFQNHLCWQKDRLFTVMNPDAEDVSEEIFLATHSDHPLVRLDTNIDNRREGAAVRWRQSPEEFLTHFLDSSRHHVQVVVQGESGSGKSHFIKWLSLHIQPSEHRYVLTIPKAGMSLRSIVEKMIDVLPAKSQQRYRDQLAQIGYQAATRDQQRRILMNRIDEAIHADVTSGRKLSDEEEGLAEDLPLIFHEPHLRDILNQRGGVIDDLVEHIFNGPKDYQRLESQRLFRQEDLPLGLNDIKLMSKQTQDMLIQLSRYPDLVAVALDLINRNLNRAIPAVLNFSGDQLSELMLEIRRFLRSEGKELVLLIEDFARLQGVDGAILQELINAGSESNGLCNMRWAMAVTRGYYEQAANTVQTRTGFLIDMDLPTSGEDGLGEGAIVSFAARYLNAARVPTEQLKAWREQVQQSHELRRPPNACEGCGFREECHAAFGAVEGVGLYPFTTNAILNMSRRRDRHLDERFNPRILIKDVMAEVLANYGRDLKAGQFPPSQLLEEMGGSQMTPQAEDRLKQDNPELFGRRRALLGLWSREPGKPDKLPEGIYRAFALAAPSLEKLATLPAGSERTVDRVGPSGKTAEGTGDGKTKVTKGEPEQVKPGKTVAAADRNIVAVQAWGRGGRMPEATLPVLREMIYATLEGYIDWDDAGLERAHFARRDGAYFKERHINFWDQDTRDGGAAGGVTIKIPLNPDDPDERRVAAIALEGLLRYRLEPHWNFEDGARSLAALSESLERWSAHLIAQFRLIVDATGLDPAPVAVETLAVGAALTGRAVQADAPLSQRVNALFESWPKPEKLSNQVKEWKALYPEFYAGQGVLIKIVKAWACGTKGGAAGGYIDPQRILPALKAIGQQWTSAAKLPTMIEKRQDEYGTLGKLHGRIAKELPGAARAEWKSRFEWLDGMGAHVPANAPWAESVKALENLKTVVRDNAVGCRQDVLDAFTTTLAVAATLPVDTVVAELKALDREKEPLHVLPFLGRVAVGDVMAATVRLMGATESFLAEVDSSVKSQELGLEAQDQGARNDQTQIAESLAVLTTVLAEIGGKHHAG